MTNSIVVYLQGRRPKIGAKLDERSEKIPRIGRRFRDSGTEERSSWRKRTFLLWALRSALCALRYYFFEQKLYI